MGNTTTRIEGAAEKLTGQLKAAVGKLLGNPRLQFLGRANELKGTAKEGFAKAVGWTRGKLQAIMGTTLRTTGAATNSADMQAAGVAKQVEGETRQTMNS
jgi:uncharacterized protein YjbJ (UPF0337 family)